jgi:hypothetical protein
MCISFLLRTPVIPIVRLIKIFLVIEKNYIKIIKRNLIDSFIKHGPVYLGSHLKKEFMILEDAHFLTLLYLNCR